MHGLKMNVDSSSSLYEEDKKNLLEDYKYTTHGWKMKIDSTSSL